jgi:acetylornithine deacetylase/succinyl-diaminopimelate desuccinylase-like protein
MTTTIPASLVESIRRQVNPQRLIDTAMALIEIPSPTRSAGPVADRLAQILQEAGFKVERPVADWPEAPAVAVRLAGPRPGRTLQFDGHLDTVHLPFVPPRLEDGVLYGSGAADMKGGIAAFVEALRVLQESDSLPAGQILLTAHDHHEGPWGDRRQLRALIEAGYVGDAVLLPEYLADRLPLAGRGMAIFEVTISRAGPPVHEVLRPPDLPDVLATGAELTMQFKSRQQELAQNRHPLAGADSIFVGQLQAGEIFNQAPTRCLVKGTRRWITPGSSGQVQADFEQQLAELARRNGVHIEADFAIQGDAFQVAVADPLVQAFQAAHTALTGAPLPLGGKPFVDDGNTFAALAGIPPLSHGPNASGAHTLYEAVAVAELVRVAQLYALTAINYCNDAENQE